MSSDNDRVATLVEEAAGIIAAAHGKVGVAKAMDLVGFSDVERGNMSIYQRVRRKVSRIAVGPREGTPPTTQVNLSSAESQVSGLSSDERKNSAPRTESSASTSNSSRTARTVRRRLLKTPPSNSGSQSTAFPSTKSPEKVAVKGKKADVHQKNCRSTMQLSLVKQGERKRQ